MDIVFTASWCSTNLLEHPISIHYDKWENIQYNGFKTK
jgi:hypothetical protein